MGAGCSLLLVTSVLVVMHFNGWSAIRIAQPGKGSELAAFIQAALETGQLSPDQRELLECMQEGGPVLMKSLAGKEGAASLLVKILLRQREQPPGLAIPLLPRRY